MYAIFYLGPTQTTNRCTPQTYNLHTQTLQMFKHKTPIPTEADLNYVHTPAPTILLHPNVAADKYYHLVMKEKLWKSWSGDSFGIKYLTDDGQEGDPFQVDVKGVVMTVRDKMILQDSQTGTPVAIMYKMFLKLQTTFKIYTFTANIPNQKPSKQKHDGRDLYEWAECKDKFFSVQKTMKTVDGVEYVMDGIGKVFAAHRQMRISRNGKPCMHAVEKTLGIFKGNQWELKIGPGIDPALMVAFMAVMDEMNEEGQSG